MTSKELLSRLGRRDPRTEQKVRVFVQLARSLAGLSTCLRRQVGCAVVPADLSKVLAIGYNGPAAGLPNDACRSSEGSCGCVHAESNAMVKLSGGSDLTLIATCAPCEHCAGLIINSRAIGAVIYLEPYRNLMGFDALSQSGIDLLGWEDRP